MKFLKTIRPLFFWSCLIAAHLAATTASHAQIKPSQEIGLDSSNPLTLSKEQALDFFLIELAIRENLSIDMLREAFRDVKYQTIARQYMVPASGSKGRKNWTSYRSNVMNTIRLDAGKRFLQEHHEFLNQLEKTSGVPMSLVVGILGVETVYGRNMGSFPVRDILTTFAFDYPPSANRVGREAMFKEQLRDHVLNCIDTLSLTTMSSDLLRACLIQEGSFAGAIGMPQFMPSSIRLYARDGNHDGKIDLRTSSEDAMQSIAQFLLAHGWKNGEPIYLPISSEMQASTILKELADGDPNPKLSLGQLKNQKIITSWPSSLDENSPALIVDLPRIEKDGSDKVDYLVGLRNFEVITQYNRSFFYAMSVTEFGQAVVQNGWSAKTTKPGKSPSINTGHHGHKR
jgi:membrane-bound lytic murein transglycosylase B